MVCGAGFLACPSGRLESLPHNIEKIRWDDYFFPGPLAAEGYTVELKVNDQKVVHSAFVRFRGLLYELGLSPHRDQVLAVKIEVDTNPPAGAVLMTTVVRRHVTLQPSDDFGNRVWYNAGKIREAGAPCYRQIFSVSSVSLWLKNSGYCNNTQWGDYLNTKRSLTSHAQNQFHRSGEHDLRQELAW